MIYANDRNRFKANQPVEDYSIDKFIYKITEKTSGETFTVNGRNVTVFKKGEWEISKDEPSLTNLKKPGFRAVFILKQVMVKCIRML